jgi:predicted Ser/Thr protein kinase/outer membrane protein assembly factor BamB
MSRPGQGPAEPSVTSLSGAPWPTTPPPHHPLGPQDPTAIGRYQLEAVLGAGGMGRVYLGRTPGGSAVAIKVVHREYAADPAFRKRFEQEVATAKRVQGLYTAPLVDADVRTDEPWLATAYIPGPSLQDAVAEHGPLPTDSARRLVAGVAEALQSIHAAGVIHRDLKPSNVILTAEGPKVIDFGIARAIDVTSVTGTDHTPGTPAYMAPEYLRGNTLTPAADVFALGALAVFAATGQQAFGIGSGQAIMLRVLELEPDLDNCPEPLRAIAAACLTKDPRQRPTPADVVQRCLQSAPANTTAIAPTAAAVDAHPTDPVFVAGRPAPADPRARPGAMGRGRWLKVAAMVAVLVVLSVVAVFLIERAESPSIEAWDDKLYPQEIPSIAHTYERMELLEVMTSERPKPSWTTPIRGGETNVVGGDSTIVLLQFDTYLSGLDPQTGKQRWPFVELSDAPASCAVREDRIGCVSRGGNGSDSTVYFLNAGSGEIVETAKVPNRELTSMEVADDRFIAMTRMATEKGFAVGYTTEGDEVWRREGHSDMYVSTIAGIMVDSSYEDEVVFVSTADGRELLRSTKPADANRDLTWNVFGTGIAIQNADWTGTDIYDLDGEKQSSVAGWEPARYQNPYVPISPVPVLARLEPYAYQDENTIAAANPETGHLLWRISGPELSTQMSTVDDKLIVNVADPAASADVAGEPASTAKEFVRVYDCITGKALSPSIDMTRDNSAVEDYWIESDGYQLIYTHFDSNSQLPNVLTGYDIASGKKTWELPLANRPGFVGGKIVAAGRPETVSLFE